jgi:hypothetical protein
VVCIIGEVHGCVCVCVCVFVSWGTPPPMSARITYKETFLIQYQLIETIALFEVSLYKHDNIIDVLFDKLK